MRTTLTLYRKHYKIDGPTPLADREHAGADHCMRRPYDHQLPHERGTGGEALRRARNSSDAREVHAHWTGFRSTSCSQCLSSERRAQWRNQEVPQNFRTTRPRPRAPREAGSWRSKHGQNLPLASIARICIRDHGRDQ